MSNSPCAICGLNVLMVVVSRMKECDPARDTGAALNNHLRSNGSCAALPLRRNFGQKNTCLRQMLAKGLQAGPQAIAEVRGACAVVDDLLVRRVRFQPPQCFDKPARVWQQMMHMRRRPWVHAKLVTKFAHCQCLAPNPTSCDTKDSALIHDIKLFLCFKTFFMFQTLCSH